MINFPASKKLWGMQLVPTITETALSPAGWTQFHIDWDWDGWVKPQIDHSVGNRIGCNAISLVGCPDGVHNGAITQATVNSRFVQVAAYCQSLGVAFYPRPAAFNQLPGMTNAAIAAYVLSILDALAPYNVIGCDVVAEADTWDDGGGTLVQGVADRCIAIYALVKAGTSLPLTFSSVFDWAGATPARAWATKIASCCDFWDFHPYEMNAWASPLVLADGNYWFSTYPSKDILFGEGGASQNYTADQQRRFLNGIASVAGSGDARFRGWFMWCAQDQNTIDSDKWGLLDASWNLRQNTANVLRQFTGGSVARNN